MYTIKVKKIIQKNKFDKKVEPTTIVKGSDGTYKIKPQEVRREEEFENNEGSFIFSGPSLLTQSNGQDSSIYYSYFNSLYETPEVDSIEMRIKEMEEWAINLMDDHDPPSP